MKDCPVTNGHIAPDCCWKPGAGMDDAIVLDIRPVTYDNPVFVGPDDRAKPDPDILANGYFANYRRVGRTPEKRSHDLRIHTHNTIGT
jgi:hypothetical protein